MKRAGLLVLILSVSLTFAEGQIIQFPDANLKAGLIQTFDGNSDGEIDTTEALRFDSVYLQDTDVTNLTGLEFFENLGSIWIINSYDVDLSGRGVASLNPISGLLNLHTLYLVNLPIDDVYPISGLTNLESLNIGTSSTADGFVTDISPLANLPNLRWVMLDNHRISNICTMASFTELQQLEFNGNQVSDISCLSALTSLLEFEFSWNPVSDISIIENMPDLYFVNVQGCQIDSISPLVTNSGIGAGDYLYIGWNLLDWEDCADIAELQSRGPAELDFNSQWNGNLFCSDPGATIYFPDNSLKNGLVGLYDFSGDGEIGVIEAAEVFDISLRDNMSVTNLEGLQHFVNANNIHIHNQWDIDLTNFVTDLSPLSGLTGLSQLQLINFSIEDLTPIANLTNLESLHVGTYVPGARITDIDVVRNFTHLNHLNIDGHQVTDICPVENLLMMQNLPFNGNLVSDISCLQNLAELDFLEFNLNPISDISVLMNFQNLTHLGAGMLGPIDISVLTGLQHLHFIYLGANGLTDISALVGNTGIGESDYLDIDWNLLDSGDCPDIEELQGRGLAQFVYNPQQTGDIFCGDPGATIYFPDNSLKNGLVGLYDFSGDGEIGVIEAAEVFDISLRDNMSVTNLEGLQHFVNANNIHIHNQWDIDLTNFVTDLSPLSGLTGLSQLQLINFSIEDLTPIANLTNLESLHVGTYVPGARITDIDVVRNFTHLNHLNIDGHQVTDICPVENLLMMQNLPFNGNLVSDISCLYKLTHMDFLELNNNPISDISVLENFQLLRSLRMGMNEITDISALSSLQNLDWVAVNHNPVADISPIVANPGIGSGDYLYIDGNLLGMDDCADIQIVQGRGLAEFVYNPQQAGNIFCGDPGQNIQIPDDSLRAALVRNFDLNGDGEIGVNEAAQAQWIALRDNMQVTNLEGLQYFVNVSSIYILNDWDIDLSGFVTDLAPLAGLTGLGDLQLINFSINDLSPIANLTNLRSLHVGTYVPSARISDISVVQNFPNLGFFNIDGHNATEICSAAGATSMYQLEFNGNQVSDISCLSALTSLVEFEFSWNPVSDISIIENMPDLYLLNVQGCQIDSISPLVANSGIGAGDYLYIGWNLLGSEDCADIAELQSRGPSELHFSPQWGGDLLCGDPAPVVYIPDANLKAHLVNNFDQNGDGEIGFDEAATVSEINSLQEFNVQDLTGLEAFVGLKTLIWENIDYNRTAPTSLEPLRTLSELQHLFLMGFGITDVEPLSNLNMLTYLFLIGVDNPDFSITGFESLTILTNLVQLGLDSFPLLNDVTPVTAFASTLRYFNFSYNDRATDLSAIGQLTELEILHINNYDMTDYSFLHNLDQLWWLEVSGGGLWDLSPIADMTDLSILYIPNCQIDSISPLLANSSLGPDDSLYMDFNYLDEDDCPDIALLESRGFRNIVYNPQRYGEICRNETPVINEILDGASLEGEAYELATVTFTDPDEDDSHTATIDWGDGTIEVGAISESSGGGSVSGSHSYHDNGVYTVTVSVTDNSGLSTSSFFEMSVANTAPLLGILGGPQDPTILGMAVTLTADFVDAGSLDTHTARWTWGDGSLSSGVVTEANGTGTAAGNHTYAQPGVYAIQLEVTDDDGDSASAIYEYIVVYDPEGAFVTGGGWIDSPPGAFAVDPEVTGMAHFGFESRYEKGANIPTGKTQFRFKAADLDFRSTAYQWLVVAGAKAMFKGSGEINGGGSYGFMLSAVDGELPGGGGVDRFRIKIWEKVTEIVVYDNQIGESEDSAPTTGLGGGSIKVHTKEK